MSDAQKLKDAIAEKRKASKWFDDKLKAAAEETRQTRQERMEKQSHQG